MVNFLILIGLLSVAAPVSAEIETPLGASVTVQTPTSFSNEVVVKKKPSGRPQTVFDLVLPKKFAKVFKSDAARGVITTSLSAGIIYYVSPSLTEFSSNIGKRTLAGVIHALIKNKGANFNRVSVGLYNFIAGTHYTTWGGDRPAKMKDVVKLYHYMKFQHGSAPTLRQEAKLGDALKDTFVDFSEAIIEKIASDVGTALVSWKFATTAQLQPYDAEKNKDGQGSDPRTWVFNQLNSPFDAKGVSNTIALYIASWFTA